MAEIKIEKKSTPIWPWILLGLALVALLIYLFSSRDEGDERDEMTEVTTEDTSYASSSRELESNNSEALAYVNFIRDDPDRMGLDHDFTNEALSKLTSATNEIANKVGYNTQQDMAKVNTHSKKISTDPFESTHANSIRDAAMILAQTLQNIQLQAFSELSSEAEEVRNSATAIKADVLTLDQKEGVKNFFRESADLIEKMNNNTPQL